VTHVPPSPTAVRRSHLVLPLLLLAALAVLPGCKGATPIKTVLDDPGQFEGKTVRIAGDVTSSVGALGAGVYKVDDGTGAIHVVAKTGGVPREGAKVGVEGKLEQGYTIGSQSLTVLVEERRTAR
jgi:hypothetical protein